LILADSVKVFLACRREGTVAGRIGDRLNERFDKVFMDAEKTEPFVNFDDVLMQRASGCDARPAVNGDRWAGPKDVASRRRLDDPQRLGCHGVPVGAKAQQGARGTSRQGAHA
jgi:hypothetical protein